jgi:hypothetical protein
VGVGIATKSLEGVAELLQQPDAPNLYWALAALPRPYMDLRAALHLERASILFSFPQLRRLQNANLSAEEWRAIFTNVTQSTGARSYRPGASSPLGAALLGAALYPRAKQWLREQGATAQEVEALTVPAALARYQYGVYESWYDEVLKLTSLPYWQAQEGLRRAERRAAEEEGSSPLLALIPAVHPAYFTGVKLDREVAALQTVEALRNYAAAHDGKFPARLEELSETPAAADPSTGKAFIYQVKDNHATLESHAPPAQPPSQGLRVEVTLVK